MALRIADVVKEVKRLEEDKNQLVTHVNDLTGKFNHEFENTKKHRLITYVLLGALLTVDIVCHFLL
tara:strand:+ start:602 stop:799 length:198 start_codon:yes stop_codon:yes gene_type:complete